MQLYKSEFSYVLFFLLGCILNYLINYLQFMGKVTEIRDAIANGSYKIDARSIAQSLLALEADLA